MTVVSKMYTFKRHFKWKSIRFNFTKAQNILCESGVLLYIRNLRVTNLKLLLDFNNSYDYTLLLTT